MDYKNKILQGNCLEVLKTLPDNLIDCCITSPPYWGLRDYGTAKWEDGDVNCDHVQRYNSMQSSKSTLGGRDSEDTLEDKRRDMHTQHKHICEKCGAKRIDEQIGLENTPEEYVEHMVQVFMEVYRIMKDTGTFWLNLGDSYYNYRPGGGQSMPQQSIANNKQDLPDVVSRRGNKIEGLKEKDLVGIPWMTAFALRKAGWYLRQDIIWSKKNCMPESVKDRCTKSHEYIFLLTKNAHYYYDNEAIKVPAKQDWGIRDRTNGKYHNEGTGLSPHTGLTKSYEKVNKRSVWEVATKPFKDSHFATFPEELIEPMVIAGCSENGLILDPFMGAGTTAVVAFKNNRNFLGIDLNSEYIDMAMKRINNQVKKRKLF